MKITKQQLKQIIKEELLKELTPEEAAGIPRPTGPTGRMPFYTERIPEYLSKYGIDIKDIAMALSDLEDKPAPGTGHSEPSYFEIEQEEAWWKAGIIRALANLLVEKHDGPEGSKE